MGDGDLDASEIEVVVSSGEVTLRGDVESREAKRLAEDLAESIQGVYNVQNQLRVNRENGNGDSSSSDSRGMSGRGGSETGSSSTMSGGSTSDASSRNRSTEASSKHR
ncbi:MAG TPA: BON domain-containing protein, partial [Vicinamibacterales bacterium]|nr:BON domain-containing protein [Vicinamibacterales bacterium]